MTSSAISLLTTVAAPAPQTTAADHAGMSPKKDATSFSETLQKADKTQGNKALSATGADAKTIKSKSTQDSPAVGATNKPSSPDNRPTATNRVTDSKESPANEVVQETEADATPDLLKVKSVSATSAEPEASETSAKPLKDKEPITFPDVVSTIAVTSTPVIDAAALVSSQIQPQTQPSDEKATETGTDNMLGTSILASISMGKSLDKTSSGEKLTNTLTKSSGDLATPAKDEAAPEVGTNATLTPAQAAKATQESSEPTIAASSPVMQKTAESSPVKASADSSADAKSGDSQARLDNVGGASPMTGAAQASVNQGGTAAAATATLQTPVSNPEWAKSLGQQLVNFHLKGDQNVQLHLNPSNLGPMSITLNVNEHLQATAHFASHSGQVRSALEQGIGQLREAMAQQGISLGETSVGEQRQQSFTQSDRGQSTRGNIQQLPGLTVVADEPALLPTASVVGGGEISTYA